MDPDAGGRARSACRGQEEQLQPERALQDRRDTAERQLRVPGKGVERVVQGDIVRVDERRREHRRGSWPRDSEWHEWLVIPGHRVRGLTGYPHRDDLEGRDDV